MAKATGIGGVFLRARDPKALYAWYEKHLGLPLQYGSFVIPAEQERGSIARRAKAISGPGPNPVRGERRALRSCC